jgi:hypothetical protein
VLNALRARGCRILPKHDQLGREARRATCPSHDDKNPSLVVTADGPNVLVKCFGGCPTSRVVAALGLNLSALFTGPRQSKGRRHTFVRPAPPPKLSPEERLARKRTLTAERTRRWRVKRQTVQSVTHQNIRSVTCDAGDACDAPNVLVLGTSHVELVPVRTSDESVPGEATTEEELSVEEITLSIVREICFEVEVRRTGDPDGGNSDRAA